MVTWDILVVVEQGMEEEDVAVIRPPHSDHVAVRQTFAVTRVKGHSVVDRLDFPRAVDVEFPKAVVAEILKARNSVHVFRKDLQTDTWRHRRTSHVHHPVQPQHRTHLADTRR